MRFQARESRTPRGTPDDSHPAHDTRLVKKCYPAGTCGSEGAEPGTVCRRMPTRISGESGVRGRRRRLHGRAAAAFGSRAEAEKEAQATPAQLLEQPCMRGSTPTLHTAEGVPREAAITASCASMGVNGCDIGA